MARVICFRLSVTQFHNELMSINSLKFILWVACFCEKKVKEVLGETPILLMGVGIADKTRDRREHHTEDFKFPTLKKMKNIETVIHA